MENIKINIDSIIEKINKYLDKNNSNPDINRLLFVLSNFKKSLHNAKELDFEGLKNTIKTYLTSIENNINAKQFGTNETFLIELVKLTSIFNNISSRQAFNNYRETVGEGLNQFHKDINLVKDDLTQKTDEIEKQLDSFDKKRKRLFYDSNTDLQNSKNGIKELNNNVQSFKDELAENQRNFDSNSKKLQDDFSKQSQELLRDVNNKANEVLDTVTNSAYSDKYQKYADKERWSSSIWYVVTVISMALVIWISFQWFLNTDYSNENYLNLISKVISTVSIGLLASYSAIQASKSKVIEMRLRKRQLEMATFDVFIKTLDGNKKQELKEKFVNKIINEDEWIKHDKNELNSAKSLKKVLEVFDFKIDVSEMINKD
jgi:hypothetical protein